MFQAATPSSPLPRQAYRPEEAAEALGVSKTTIWRWRKAGRLRFVRVGRIALVPAAEIDRLLADVYAA